MWVAITYRLFYLGRPIRKYFLCGYHSDIDSSCRSAPCIYMLYLGSLHHIMILYVGRPLHNHSFCGETLRIDSLFIYTCICICINKDMYLFLMWAAFTYIYIVCVGRPIHRHYLCGEHLHIVSLCGEANA